MPNTIGSKAISVPLSALNTDPVIEIIEGDGLRVMREMASASIPLIVTSPPYNIRNSSGGGFRSSNSGNWKSSQLSDGYGRNADDHSREVYKAWLRECVTEMIRLIPDDGAIFLNLKERVQGGVRETPEEIVRDLPVRQRLTWQRAGSNNHNRGYFLPDSEIIYFFAGADFEVAEDCRPYGTVWKVPQERGSPHPAPFPIELPRRCLRSAPEQMLVLDPFCGWGTTGLACIEQGRNFIGIEVEQSYIRQSFERLMPELWRTDALLRMHRHSSAGQALDWSEFTAPRREQFRLPEAQFGWPTLMTADVAALYLSVGVKTLRNRGPKPVHLGRSVRYSKDVLDDWVNELNGSLVSSDEREPTAKEIEERFFARRARRDA